MKKDVLTIKLGRPKTRTHGVLFTKDTPFKPKQVESKKAYTRKPKHANRRDYEG